MVLKPTEIAPINALIFAEVMHEAGVPAGVFNLVNGTGPDVGVAMSSHPDIDMMSFTGSTRAGISVAQEAAKTVKRVTQELGGKSPNIILDDADFAAAVSRDMAGMCMNTGQSCNAPTRMRSRRAWMKPQPSRRPPPRPSWLAISDAGTRVGPLVSRCNSIRCGAYRRASTKTPRLKPAGWAVPRA